MIPGQLIHVRGAVQLTARALLQPAQDLGKDPHDAPVTSCLQAQQHLHSLLVQDLLGSCKELTDGACFGQERRGRAAKEGLQLGASPALHEDIYLQLKALKLWCYIFLLLPPA